LLDDTMDRVNQSERYLDPGDLACRGRRRSVAQDSCRQYRLVLSLALSFAAAGCARPPAEVASAPRTIDDALRAASTFPSPADVACGACHQKAYEEWAASQHAHANRLVDEELDRGAFQPSRYIMIGGFHTRLGRLGHDFGIHQLSPDGQRTAHVPEAVIGVTPLVQYLVPFPGGRLQAVDMAYDPRSNEWFNVFEEENRQLHEWGFWKNRGLNWNSQCAFCHMTNLRKGYDEATDTYRTTWDSMGIGCSQCHGHMPAHAANPTNKVVEAERIAKAQSIENCGSCHARREELTGAFRPGGNFDDHYRLQLADTPGVYYADGQVLMEDFEYTSFRLSRMGHKGVICLDCHNPHSGKLLTPAANNMLCLTCHLAPGQRGAIVVDLLTHSRHKPGSTGDLCIECHMPVTHYMARDPRRDHGFTIPDPLLTKELGIPNACNRCHTNVQETVEWAAGWTEKWYGPKMERRTRARARLVARAQRDDPSVVPDLLAFARQEEIAAWRATLVQLLDAWSSRPEVRSFLEASLAHESPLVRAAAIRGLGNTRNAYALLKPLRHDPSRLVRIDAAWATLNAIEGEKPSIDEVEAYLRHNSDQPAGAFRRSQYELAVQRPREAEAWLRKALAWDNSPQMHQLLGQFLNGQGRQEEALQELLKARDMAPNVADMHFVLALCYAEAGQTGLAIASLEKTVELDPAYGRAWYNLGLGYAQLERLPDALKALDRAEALMPDSPEPAYAAATIHLRLGETAKSGEAARRALKIQPDYEPAKELLTVSK
jgi:tetratricopeptide (TPR) repeat protein